MIKAPHQSHPVRYGHLLLSLIFVFIVGCSDPYAVKLPDNARLTPAEIEEITEKLELSDQSIFRRWAERHAKGEEFGGEGSAPTVKVAILNQMALEARQKVELEAVKAQRALDQKAALQKAEAARLRQAQIEQMAEERREVDAEIRKHFTAQAIGYEWRPLFNRNGEEFARQWLFRLKLTNNSGKVITGAAGWANISDVFNANLGSYPFRIEPRIKPGQTIEFEVFMDYDRNDPKHVEMTQTKSLRVSWFFESVAFVDGTNVDFRSLKKPSAPVVGPSKIGSQKSVEL